MCMRDWRLEISHFFTMNNAEKSEFTVGNS